MDETPALADLIGTLRRDVDALRTENAALSQENAALKQLVTELQRRLDKTSSNSSKPPSSDGLKKPPRVLKSSAAGWASRAAARPATRAIPSARWTSPTGSSAMRPRPVDTARPA